jgi:hypothetical protein
MWSVGPKNLNLDCRKPEESQVVLQLWQAATLRDFH